MAAIYCPPWPKDVEVTTTLYPIVVVDYMQVAASFNAGWMAQIPHDEIEASHDVQSASYIQARWWYTDGPYDDYTEASHDIQAGSYIQTRWWYLDGPYDDYTEATHDIQSGSYIRLIVRAKTGSTGKPYERLQMVATINDTCTMDAV
jgi:hypothetical protein